MDGREKRMNDSKALLENVANTHWRFYCPGDKTVFMISSESSGWPKDLSLHRKLSLQKHAKVQIRNPRTRKIHECSLVDSGTEEYLREKEIRGTHVISNMDHTLPELSVSFSGDENIPPLVPSANTGSDLDGDDEVPEPTPKRQKFVKITPVFEQSPVILNDHPGPLTSTPCGCDNSKVSFQKMKIFKHHYRTGIALAS